MNSQKTARQTAPVGMRGKRRVSRTWATRRAKPQTVSRDPAEAGEGDPWGLPLFR